MEEYSINKLFDILMTFSRVGSIFMFLPGIGETKVNSRIRLILSLFISAILTPLVFDYIPDMPNHPMMILLYLCKEISIGIFFGLMIKIIFSSLQIAGTLISMQSSLGSAMVFDPHQRNDNLILTNLYTITATTIYYAAFLDHHVIEGIIESYRTIQPGDFMIDDIVESLYIAVSKSMVIGFKLSTPVVVVAIIIYVTGGILSKLMPGIQVFFLIVPIQLGITFFIILFSLTGSVLWFLNEADSFVNSIFSGIL